VNRLSSASFQLPGLRAIFGRKAAPEPQSIRLKCLLNRGRSPVVSISRQGFASKFLESLAIFSKLQGLSAGIFKVRREQ
jgi:hypothetical protein